MAEQPTSEPSTELLELILFALDHGIESVRGGGPLIPFLATIGSGRPTLARFVAESADRGREMAAGQAAARAADRGWSASTAAAFLASDPKEPARTVAAAGCKLLWRLGPGGRRPARTYGEVRCNT